MTIREFVHDLEATGNKALAEEMQNITSVWNNDSCRGYAIASLQAAGYTRDQISVVLEKMTAAFDEIEIEAAAKIRNV